MNLGMRVKSYEDEIGLPFDLTSGASAWKDTRLESGRGSEAGSLPRVHDRKLQISSFVQELVGRMKQIRWYADIHLVELYAVEGLFDETVGSPRMRGRVVPVVVPVVAVVVYTCQK